MKARKHGEALWWAALIHRLSGLALGVFLPIHFWLLSMALDPGRLDAALSWTDLTIVKVAEFGLVFLLAVHLFGGLRVMALEWLPWSPHQKTFAALAIALSVFVAVGFFLRAIG